VRELLVLGGQRLGQALVHDDRVSLGIEHDVLRLEVALHDLFVVQLLDADDDFWTLENEHVRFEELEFLEVLEEFSVFLVVSDEEEFSVVLETEAQLGYERFLPELLENQLFVDWVLDLAFECEVVFVQHFQCLDFGVQFAFDQLHLTKRTHPY